MSDRREQILTQLTALVAGLPGVALALRNRTGLSETRRPALIVLDADEAAVETEFGGSRPFDAASLVVMTPEIFILVSAPAELVGSELNRMRSTVIRGVLQDPVLRGLVGTNGDIRYAGCSTSLAAGRSMEGEMAVSFALRYVLKPADLEA